MHSLNDVFDLNLIYKIHVFYLPLLQNLYESILGVTFDHR
jgi:hypothetical protein